MGEPRSADEEECLHRIPGMYRYNKMVLYDATPSWVIEPCRNFRFRKGDILVATYCKAGTSFIQEIVYLIQHKGDTEAAGVVPSFQRVPYMELCLPKDCERKKSGALEMLQEMPEDQPRMMKSHFPVDFYLDKISSVDMKVVLCMRNVKDTLVSFYHFYRMNKALNMFKGTWDDFFSMFQKKQLIYGDYFDWVVPYWEAAKKHSNIYTVTYEDLKKNLKPEIYRLADFLGQTLTEDQVNKIIEFTDFKNMAANEATNYSALPIFDFKISPFLRKGTVGDWKNYFTAEQNDIVDHMIKEHLDGTGLTFQYE